jgi:hypothetical protein
LLLVLLAAFVVRQVRLIWQSDPTTKRLTARAGLGRLSGTIQLEREIGADTGPVLKPLPSRRRKRRRRR